MKHRTTIAVEGSSNILSPRIVLYRHLISRQLVRRGFLNSYPSRIRCHAEAPWNRAPTGRRILFVAEGGHGIEPRRAVRRQITGENGHGG